MSQARASLAWIAGNIIAVERPDLLSPVKPENVPHTRPDSVRDDSQSGSRAPSGGSAVLSCPALLMMTHEIRFQPGRALRPFSEMITHHHDSHRCDNRQNTANDGNLIVGQA